jgi:uncharacterized protein (TIGR03435 family)
MPTLASLLSTFGTGNVTDETGLPYFYNFRLIWNETEAHGLRRAAPNDSGTPAKPCGAASSCACSLDGPSVFSAVQQLGLRLEPHKVPASYFVIESAQRPGRN